jgi:hypothetical protein
MDVLYAIYTIYTIYAMYFIPKVSPNKSKNNRYQTDYKADAGIFYKKINVLTHGCFKSGDGSQIVKNDF